MSNKQTPVNLPQHSLTKYSLADQEIQTESQSLFTHELSTHTNIKVGGYTCWWHTRAKAEACCAKEKHAGPVEKVKGSYACYVDKGTWDSD